MKWLFSSFEAKKYESHWEKHETKVYENNNEYLELMYFNLNKNNAIGNISTHNVIL